MDVISQIDEFLTYRNDLEPTIALVPTMGNLHSGHLALVNAAREHAKHVIATIFVNPMQFGANEDLDKYPRTLEADLEKLQAHGVTAVFTPPMTAIYPDGVDRHTQVSVPELSDLHCGLHRPGHFTGVASIVCKLFNLSRPDVAVFGQKDYQQLAVIRKMTSDLAIQTTIISVPTVRNAQGLALSSRNNYLSEADLAIAPALFNTLTELKASLLSGLTQYEELESEAIKQLNQTGFDMEYIKIVDQKHLRPAQPEQRQLVILAAGRLAGTRLIDNIEVQL